MMKFLRMLFCAILLFIGTGAFALAVDLSTQTPNYDWVSDFSENLACVRMGDLYGFVDENYELVIPVQFAGSGQFQDGIAIMSDDSACDASAYQIIDKTGAILAEGVARFIQYSEYDRKITAISPKGKVYYYIVKDGLLQTIASVPSHIDIEFSSDSRPLSNLRIGCIPAMHFFANAISPQVTVYANAYLASKALENGAIDVLISFSGSDDMGKFPSLKIARDALIFMVNNKNEMGNIRISDIERIYSGDCACWSDIFEAASEASLNWFEAAVSDRILPYQCDPASDAQDYFLSLIPCSKLIDQQAEYITSWEMTDSAWPEFFVEYTNFTNSIGFTSLHCWNVLQPQGVKALSVNGIAPAANSLKSDAYPLAITIEACTREADSEITAALKQFVSTDEYFQMLHQMGYLAY